MRIGFAISSDDASYDSQWWLDDVRIDGSDWGAMSSVGLAQPGDSVDEAYVTMGGTSMATPLTAGAAALVREWYNDQGVANPSGALLKATLLNGAADMAPGQYGTGSAQEVPGQRPNNVTGWGRVDLVESLDPPVPRTIWFTDTTTGLSTGESAVYTLTVGTLIAQAAAQFNQPQFDNVDAIQRPAPEGFGAASRGASCVIPPGIGQETSPNVRAPLGTELLSNGGFETMYGGLLQDWFDNTYGMFVNQTNVAVHSGAYSAFMGGYICGAGESLFMYQGVALPISATAAILQVYSYGVDLVGDTLEVELWQETGDPDTLVEVYTLSASNGTWTANTWILSQATLNTLKGSTVYVGFRAITVGYTHFYLLDDVSFAYETGSVPSASLTITPESGPRGTTFSVVGSDFNAGALVTVTFDGASLVTTPTDDAGGFSISLTPDGTIAKGNHTFTAVDTGGHRASDTFEIVPQVSVSVSPASGQAGETFTVAGVGFHGGSPLTVTLDGAVDGITTAHTSGAFTYTLTTDVGVPAGSHLVSAIDDEASTAGDTVTITASTARRVSISPSTGPTGTTFTISGTNFTPGAVVTLTVDTAFIMTTTADAGGAFHAPYTPTNLSVGQHILRADDGDGQAQTTFTIAAPPTRQVGIAPASGPNSTTFTITGINFTPNAIITLTVDGAFIMTTIASGDGAFSTFYTPTGLNAGEHTLVADDGDGQAYATFMIKMPSQTGGPFRVTLAWMDYPGEPSAAKALVNDLDLEVIAPDGAHYYGNQGLYTSGQCLRGGQWDACNNVEGAVISDALYGTYTVIVHGVNIPQGPQPFALVASGDQVREGIDVPLPPDRQLSISPAEGPNGICFTVVGSNFMASAGVTLTVDSGFIKTVTTDANGAFTTPYTPTSLSAAQHTLIADDGVGQAQTTFTITTSSARQVSITPTEGFNGTLFTVAGSNFTTSAVVTLTVASDFIKTATTDASGAFTTPYTPADLEAGEHILVVTDGEGQAQTTFSIEVHAIYLPLVLRE